MTSGKSERQKPVAIVPVAGVTESPNPQTQTVPKPLLNVAGKPVLGHILDGLHELDVARIVVVVGEDGDRITEFIAERYRDGVEVVVQRERLGVGHAVLVTEPLITHGPILIILGDTLVEPDWPDYLSGDEITLGVKEVADPRRFGVVEVRDDEVLDLVEKPADPAGNLALVGLYYFPAAENLFDNLRTMQNDLPSSTELHLTDAIRLMLKQQNRVRISPVAGWFDCGETATLLGTNQHLLSRVPLPAPIRGVTLIPPVFIAPTARIEASILGPHVSVADGAVIRRAIVRDSIINESSLVEDILLEKSVVGENALVRGSFSQVNVGDASEVNLSGINGHLPGKAP